MPDSQVRTPLASPKGILSISVIWVYIGMWAYIIYKMMNSPNMTVTEMTEFLLMFAGATGVMGMIVLLIIQNFFRKTEAG